MTWLASPHDQGSVQDAFAADDGPMNLLVDGTGIKFLGDGKWRARKHSV